MRFLSHVLVFVVSANFASHAAKLPSSFGRCHKSDPGFEECVAKNVEDAIHKLKDGAPELGLQPFEPLLISELTIGQGKGPVNVQQNFFNVKLHGLTGSKVYAAKNDFENHVLNAYSITPELRLEADYEMNGRVLLLPIQGKGPCNVTLVNTSINHTLTAEPFQKKNKTFYKIKEYTVTLRPEQVIYNFENLFNGDKRLGDEINKVLNENWDAVFTDVREGYEKSFGLIFHDLANRVYSRVALKDIYLD